MFTTLISLLLFLLVILGLPIALIVYIGRSLNAKFPKTGSVVELLLRHIIGK